MPNDWTRILPREERFVVALVKNGGDRKAALGEAGYSTGTQWSDYAYKILQRPRVKKRLAELQERVAEKATYKLTMSREAIISELEDNVRLAKEKGDLPSANRALELLGKTIALYSDKTVSGDLDGSLAGKTPEELEALCKALVLNFGPAVVTRWLNEARPKAEGDVAVRDGEDLATASEEEAGDVPPLSEAGGVSPGRSLQ